MEGPRKYFLNRNSTPQFKKAGGPRKGKQHNSVHEEYSENFHSSDTVYRILCQSKKIGSVIGKGGNIVKALREDSQAKITVSDSVPGSDERIIIIFSPSDKRARRHSGNNDRGYDAMEPHCAAQDALLKVHDRIIEEDLGGAENGNRDETAVSARLLVSNNMVGCLLGRKGDVIQRLRSETGANIRVLPADHLPGCAVRTDELVQISGKRAIVRKALYEISTLLHQNPRKDKPPPSFPAQGFHPPMRDMLPPRDSPWLERTIEAERLQPMHFEGRRYGNEPSAYRHDDFDVTPPHDMEAPIEFMVKILCSSEKIGGVIGKGGSNVRQLEQETGASIHVENVSKESDERVIRISSFEALWDPRSQTIDAILYLQNRTSEYSDKGMITTRLLVPSSKVGCLLGQGGHVINDMRRRTHADIRVFSKEEKPKCASEDEELVQISGSLGVAKDALVEVVSRLRTRCFRDANPRGEPALHRPIPGFNRLPLSSNIVSGSPGRYEHLQGCVRDYEPPSYPIPPPRHTGYLDVDEAKISSLPPSAGSRITEFGGSRLKGHDPYSSGSDFGTSDHYHSSRYLYEPPASSNNYPPQSYNSQHHHAHAHAHAHSHSHSHSHAAEYEYPNNIASPLPYHNSNSQYQNVYKHHNIRSHGSDSYHY